MGFFSNLFAPSEPLNPLEELRKTTLPINGANELLNIIKRIENGEAYASWLVGGCYESGSILTPKGGVSFPKNKAKALWWKIKSGEDGCASSQYTLGRMYFFGDGETNNLVQRDYLKALKWWGKAAENGEFCSLGALGEIFYQGNGVPINYEKAFEWFSKSINHPTAKECGFYDAAQRIGEMYAAGRGVHQDFIQAYKWMTIAGCDPNLHHEFPLRGKLTPSELEKANVLIKEWHNSVQEFRKSSKK